MPNQSSSSNPDTSAGTICFYSGAKKDSSPWNFLSQWYPSSFHTGDGTVIYKTAEQYMMHQKTLLFSDTDVAAMILEVDAPRDQKALGRCVKNFDEKIWNENRLRIVTEGNYHKFVHCVKGDDLKRKLLATGERELVEASPRDRIWGIGFGEAYAERNRKRWGLNLLGKALVDTRKRIREEEKVAR